MYTGTAHAAPPNARTRIHDAYTFNPSLSTCTQVRRTQHPPTHVWGSELVGLLPSLSVPYEDVMVNDTALLQLLRLVQRFVTSQVVDGLEE